MVNVIAILGWYATEIHAAQGSSSCVFQQGLILRRVFDAPQATVASWGTSHAVIRHVRLFIVLWHSRCAQVGCHCHGSMMYTSNMDSLSCLLT